jgi:hypothetical protein
MRHMKLVPVRISSNPNLNTAAVLKVVLNQSPQKGLNIAEMRVRSKILDKVEAAERGDAKVLLLEDAEHQCLREACSTYPWPVFDRDLLRILEDVDGALAPPTPVEAMMSRSDSVA